MIGGFVFVSSFSPGKKDLRLADFIDLELVNPLDSSRDWPGKPVSRKL
jgi:hypothetical protein